MLKALDEQKQNGVDIKVIGAAGRGVAVTALIASTNNGGEKDLRKLEMRLLAASVTDGREAFVGSQSLRKAELDSRREVGLTTSARRSEMTRPGVALPFVHTLPNPSSAVAMAARSVRFGTDRFTRTDVL